MVDARYDTALIEELSKGLKIPRLDASVIEPLGRFVELASQWDKVHDLTAAKNKPALVEILCADALLLAMQPWLRPGMRIVDVGSGGGAPALPLAIARPDLRFTLVEPRQKRVAFMRLVIGSLGLQDRVTLLNARLDEKTPQVAGMPFDVAMSRATFTIEQWQDLGRRIADAVVLFAVDQSGLPEVDSDLQVHDWHYVLPFSKAPRHGRMVASNAAV